MLIDVNTEIKEVVTNRLFSPDNWFCSGIWLLVTFFNDKPLN